MSETGDPAYSATNTFSYTRTVDRFEQVMAYYWLTEATVAAAERLYGKATARTVKAVFQDRGIL